MNDYFHTFTRCPKVEVTYLSGTDTIPSISEKRNLEDQPSVTTQVTQWPVAEVGDEEMLRSPLLPWPGSGLAPLVGGCSQPAAERSSLGDRAPGCYGLRTLCLFSWDVHTRLL